MRTVGFDKDKFERAKQGSTDLLEAIVIRELLHLYSEPILNAKQIISLERLGALLLKKKSGDREETVLLNKMNNGKELPAMSEEDLKGLLESIGV